MPLRKSFQERLDELEITLLRMGNLTLETIQMSKVAFELNDYLLCEKIILGDDEIDAYIVEIEEKCIEVLALQAPVAIDLRRVFVIMRTAMHLERIGDLCVNICKVFLVIKGQPISPGSRQMISDMFMRAIAMLNNAVHALRKPDLDMVNRLSQMDDTVDRIHRKFLAEISSSEEKDIEVTVRVLMIARFIERIADHSVDIGEDMKYLVTGKFLE